jgi:uncharacterized protein involved in exopolysaccharide biosynthesis
MMEAAWAHGLKRPLLIGSAAALIMVLVAALLPDTYRSEARILPVEARGQSAGLGNLAMAAAAFGINMPVSDGDANFVDIIKSRRLGEQVLATAFTFRERSWLFGSEKTRAVPLERYLKAANRDRAIAALTKLVKVTRDPKTKIITLSANTRSPELSQQVAQCYLQLLERFAQESGRTRGSAKAFFSSSRLDEAGREMDKAEDDFRSFWLANRNFQSSNDPLVRLRGARLENELQLRRQLVTTLAVNREQALMEEKNDMPILNVLDKPNLPIERSGPRRSLMAFSAGVMAGIGTWIWGNRKWIKIKLSDEGEMR